MNAHPAEDTPPLVASGDSIVQSWATPGNTMHDPCGAQFESFVGPLENIRTEATASDLACDLARTVTAGSNPRCPESREEWLAKLESTVDLVEMGRLLAWGLFQGFLTELQTSAGPARLPALRPRSGELFPLPVLLPDEKELRNDELPAAQQFDLGVRCWVAVGCRATNALYQTAQSGLSRKPGKVHVRALEDMTNKVKRFLEGAGPMDGTFNEAVAELKTKRISYTGEEIAQPCPLSVSQIIKGLPPVGHGGSIPILPFVKGYTRWLLENPMEAMLPESERGGSPVSAKVHIKKGEELDVFRLLTERGITTWVPSSTAFSDHRGTYLSGLFGVTKQGKFTDDNQPVLRVITNLIPTNGLFTVLRGDIDLLPSATGWLPILLESGDVVTMNQCDMASAFYLFQIPAQWHPFFCLNFVTDGSNIGLDKGKLYRPTIRVLPMGWNSSVGVMQQISREILLGHGLPPEQEFRKTGPVPLWFAQVVEKSSSSRSWWQVYLDNFLSGERHDGDGGSVGAGLQGRALGAWEAVGVLSAEDKQVLNSRAVVELGVRFDGERGLLGASASRLLKTIWVSLYLLRNGRWSQKEAQVVLGRWVFILQFRRAAMSVLAKSWRAVESPWPKPSERNTLLQEVMKLICMGPLLQSDLTASFEPHVTCSDASETGGASAVSSDLTWSGRSLASARCDLRLRPLEVPIVVLSIFNGIGGAFRLYDVLGLVPMGRIAVELYKPANRTTRTAWPNVMEFHDVCELTYQDVQKWAALFPRALELHAYAGFPCVHLSAVRAFRQNLDGEGSNLFWRLLEILGWVTEVFSPFCKVKWCVENVASMDESARKAISAELEVMPIKLDPSDCMPFNRPRFAWSSVELHQMEGVSLYTECEYVRAYLSTGVEVSTQQWIRPGWKWHGEQSGTKFATFMKSIKRKKPPPVPVGYDKATPEMIEMWQGDSFRFPPYQYHPKFWLERHGFPPRLLDASERELLMGFGAGHTDTCQSASVKKRSLADHEDIRKSLCGDSFAILPFAVIAASLCEDLVPRMTPQQILLRLGLAPGQSAHPSVQVPITRLLAYGGDTSKPCSPLELTKQLGLSVNHTGADVRVVTGQVLGHKSPTHASVRAWWWQWKQLFTVRWKGHNHINYLEMKMILHSLLWRCRDPKSVNKRWVHLEDSMVCLLILTKGRTSSRLLQPLTSKIGALQLAMGAVLLHAHVGSDENPTDAGSRS